MTEAVQVIATALMTIEVFLSTHGGAARAQANPAPCEIEEIVQGTQITLHGVVSGSSGQIGRYRLQVAKSDAAGSSRVVQAGEFKLEPTGRARVGSVGISVQPGGRYDAMLSLEIDGRMLECRASGPVTVRL